MAFHPVITPPRRGNPKKVWDAGSDLRKSLQIFVVLLSVLLGPMGAIGIAPAQAASFDCKLASNDSERSICADPFLIELDARLATAWQIARKLTKDPDALQADQRAWLKRRDEGCGADVTCLRRLYRWRLPLLDPAAVTGDFTWAGDWYRSDRPDMVMHVRPTGQDRFFITIDMPKDHMHTEGPAMLVNAELSYANVYKGDDLECAKVIRRVHRQIEVWNADLSCTYGSSRYFMGRYLPVVAGADKVTDPAPDLLGYGAIIEPEHDARLRLLLGDDQYRRLSRIFEAYMKTDVKDAGVDLALKGFGESGANHEEALLLETAGRFWVGFLEYRDNDPVQLRYYSNVPGWERKLPQTIRDWQSRDIPVQWMSAPGAPVEEHVR